jgi:hypothetical protein
MSHSPIALFAYDLGDRLKELRRPLITSLSALLADLHDDKFPVWIDEEYAARKRTVA